MNSCPLRFSHIATCTSTVSKLLEVQHSYTDFILLPLRVIGILPSYVYTIATNYICHKHYINFVETLFIIKSIIDLNFKVENFVYKTLTILYMNFYKIVYNKKIY